MSPGGCTEGMSVIHGKKQAVKQQRTEQLLEDGTLQNGLKASYGMLNENCSAFETTMAPVQNN